MADNVRLSVGTADGATIATDDDGTAQHQYVKLEFGPDNTQTKVADASPLPIKITDGTDVALVSAGGALLVDASASTQPVSNAGLTELAAAINVSSQMDVNVAANGIGLATSAKQDTIIGHVDGIETLIGTTNSSLTTIDGRVDGIEALLTTIDADTSGIITSVQLLDDAVQVLGTDTYTEAASKGITLGAVRRDADTTLVNTTNEFGPLQMDANGRLKVEAFSGETLPVSGTVTINAIPAGTNNIGDVDVLSIAAGDNNIGNVDIVTVPTDPFGANADAGSATGSISAKLRFIASTGIPVTGTVTVGSHAVTNAGTFLVQENGTHVQVDDAAFTPATSKIMMAGFEADEGSTDSVDEGDGGAARMTLDRKQIVTLQPHTAGGLTTFMASGSDGSSILVATAQVIKASAGQLYGYYAYNPEAAASFVHFYNTAAASVTVGTTNPMFTIAIPAGSAANLTIPQGILFSNAGWSCAATTTAGGNTGPATGVSLVAWYA